MAQQTIPAGFNLPAPNVNTGIYALNYNNFGGFLLGSTISRVAWIFQIPKTGTLDQAEFFVGFVSSPQPVKFSFQDVDFSTGFPDGTVDQYRVVTGMTAGWIAPGLITSDGTNTGTKRSVTQGDYLALVAEWDSTQSGEVDFYAVSNNGNFEQSYMPLSLNYSGGSWAKILNRLYSSIALKYNDGTYAPPGDIVYPIEATNARIYNNGSSPDERGLYFSVPVPMTIDGGWFQGYVGGTLDVVLYDTDGTTVLTSTSMDPDLIPASAVNALRCFRFPTAVALTAGGHYRMTMKPTSGTNVQLVEGTAHSTAIMDAWAPGAGWQLTTRTDAGSWTQTTTDRPFMGIHVAQIADDAGAGPTPVTHAYAHA